MEDGNKSTNSTKPEVAPQINSKYPTELVDLPSEGWFYPKDHPLASGQIEMRYMSARDEDILTSANLIKKGVVLDKLLKGLIVTPCNYDEFATVHDNSCIEKVFGCTDNGSSLNSFGDINDLLGDDQPAFNYMPEANTDDGTCLVCVGTITAPWTEDFDSYLVGSTDFSGNGWYNDSLLDTWNWTIDNLGTPSFNTGPSGAFDGSYYMYTEASFGGSNSEAIMYVPCVDPSQWTQLALSLIHI